MKVGVLALDGVFDTGLSALLDIFAAANELGSIQGQARPLFKVQIVGIRERVHTALGLVANVDPTSKIRKPDWIVVPALNAKQPAQLLGALQREDVVEAMAQLKTWRSRGVGIAAACTGTFVLAEAGLLDGLEATTTWSLAPTFRQRYEHVRLDDTRMIVTAPQITTAGAAMGHIDLGLWLVRQASPEVAALVARVMLIDKRPSQAKYVIPDFLAHSDPLIERFDRWAREHLATGFSLQKAAHALSVTPRTLQRRTDAVLGKSPLAFFQDLRVQHAQHLVSMGEDLAQIANEVGYAEPTTLRNLLRRRTGRTVRELRSELA